jgi:uncharacterized lipoprotein YddW (UPF0748 family)
VSFRRPITLVALALILLAAGAPAEQRLTPEGRALWVPAWELTSPAAVDRVVDLAAAAGFNEIFLQVRYRGDALYLPNRLNDLHFNPEPRSEYLASQPADFDPLARACALAHAAGINLHAWVVCFEITGGHAPYSPDHVVYRRPEWITRDSARRPLPLGHRCWLDPGVPAVRDYTAEVLADIVANYPLDGLHLDYVRYRDAQTGYAAAALEEFRRSTGVASPEADPAAWTAWRRENITAFVAEVSHRAHELRPDLVVSAAVYAERAATAYNDVSQDWGIWLADGLIDLVVTMSYFTERATIVRQLDDAVRHAEGALVYAGLLLRELHDERELIPTAALRDWIDAVRLRGADGTALFSFSDLLERRNAGLPLDELFDNPARPPVPDW